MSMTLKDFEPTKATRELDRRVAKLIIGLPDVLISIAGPIMHEGHAVREIDAYSSTAEGAWAVRLKMKELGWISHDQITWMGWGADRTKMGFSIWFERWENHEKKCFHAHAGDLNEAYAAVCVAALAAIEKRESRND